MPFYRLKFTTPNIKCFLHSHNMFYIEYNSLKFILIDSKDFRPDTVTVNHPLRQYRFVILVLKIHRALEGQL